MCDSDSSDDASPYAAALDRWKAGRQKRFRTGFPKVSISPDFCSDTPDVRPQKKLRRTIESDDEDDETKDMSQDSLDSLLLDKGETGNESPKPDLNSQDSFRRLLERDSSDEEDMGMSMYRVSPRKEDEKYTQTLKILKKIEDTGKSALLEIEESPKKCGTNVVAKILPDEFVHFTIKHREKLLKFDIPKKCRLEVLFKQICERENLNLIDLQLFHDTDQVVSSDVAESFNATHVILDTCIISEATRQEIESGEIRDANMINIQLQTSSNRKDTKRMAVNKSETFCTIKQRYADLVNENPSQLQFIFDNCILRDNETPAGLDMEEDDTVDVQVTK